VQWRSDIAVTRALRVSFWITCETPSRSALGRMQPLLCSPSPRNAQICGEFTSGKTQHGILIVEFASDLQRTGLSKREATERAAGIRLRPILMTMAAMVLDVIPLITATGAGAVARFNMGW
jgi:hypothetical protein